MLAEEGGQRKPTQPQLTQLGTDQSAPQLRCDLNLPQLAQLGLKSPSYSVVSVHQKHTQLVKVSYGLAWPQQYLLSL